jgi:hypothetical protein
MEGNPGERLIAPRPRMCAVEGARQRTCLIQPESTEVCIAARRIRAARPMSGLTSVFGGTSLKALRFGSHPGTTLPPLAAIVGRPHSLGDLQ